MKHAHIYSFLSSVQAHSHFYFSIICCYYGFWTFLKSCLHSWDTVQKNSHILQSFSLGSSRVLFLPSPVLHHQSDWRAAFLFFCWVCFCLPSSLSQSSPSGFTFSKYHHSSPGRGAGGGWGGWWGAGGRYGRGPVMGQSLPLTPPFLLHKLLRIQASATDSSHTPLLQPLQWGSKFIQGRRDLLPSFAPLLLHPCLLPLLFSSFISCLSPSFLGSSPLPSTLLPWSLSSPHWGVIPPTLFH